MVGSCAWCIDFSLQLAQGHTDLPLIDEVCKLCRNTGYVPGQPKPPKYPEDYFKRYRIRSLSLSLFAKRKVVCAIIADTQESRCAL
jgi:rRNA maturation protein Nop10